MGGVAGRLGGGRWVVVVVGGDRMVELRCGGSRRLREVCRGHVEVVIVDIWGQGQCDGGGG